VHLGKYEKSERLFREFLDDVADDLCVEHLVLIGDILDMWRGDADTLLSDYEDILETLRDLLRRELFTMWWETTTTT